MKNNRTQSIAPVKTGSFQTRHETPRKYYRVITELVSHKGYVPVRHEGAIMLKPSQLKNYARSLNCVLMRHLPVCLKGKDVQP